jgi:dihydrofolate synthase/folylpolyglutamate synthase
MRAALDALGRPQDSFASILVAGTNGKGSTAAAIASALSRSGRLVGLYTSPHILDYRERIRLQGRLAGEDLLLRLLERDWDIWQRHELSFFEATTALAMCAFREAGVRAAVLEVGLGGRLDATNTVEPVLSVITSLGMDHAHLLGSTPAAIALEKAGIMRPGVPVALAGGGAEGTRAALGRARELDAPAFLRRDCLRVSRVTPTPRGSAFLVGGRRGAPSGWDLPAGEMEVEMPLPGAHQITNGALAVLALSLLRAHGWEIQGEDIRQGLKRLRWPGRLERPLRGVPLLADVAHNREGALVIAHHLRSLARRRELRPVVGMLEHKDHEGFFRALRGLAAEVRLAPLDEPRAAPVEDLAACARSTGLRVRLFPSVATALHDALEGAKEPEGPLVLLCGSFHTLDEGYRALGVRPAAALWEEEP